MGTAIVGLIGVLVGALVSALVSYHLQRRLWQRQEGAKAYFHLFESWDGLREEWRRVVSRLCISAEEGERLKRAQTVYEKAFAPLDKGFLRQLRSCWMLEYKPELRAKVKAVQSAYKEGSQAVFFRIHNSHENTVAGLGGEERFKKLLDSETVTKEVRGLRLAVTREYFHGDEEENVEETGAGRKAD